MAKKSVKKATKKVEKVELKESFDKIKNTAQKVNAQVMETTTEVVEDVFETGKQLRNAATKTVKNTFENAAKTARKTIDNIDVEKGIEQVKTTAKAVNEYSLETAEEIVNETLKNGKKWQSIASKAIDGGFDLAAKQQDIVFDTLETVKGQLAKSAVRFRKLFKAN